MCFLLSGDSCCWWWWMKQNEKTQSDWAYEPAELKVAERKMVLVRMQTCYGWHQTSLKVFVTATCMWVHLKCNDIIKCASPSWLPEPKVFRWYPISWKVWADSYIYLHDLIFHHPVLNVMTQCVDWQFEVLCLRLCQTVWEACLTVQSYMWVSPINFNEMYSWTDAIWLQPKYASVLHVRVNTWDVRPEHTWGRRVGGNKVDSNIPGLS